MAAGRHGGYRENEFRDRETDIGMVRRETRYPRRVYDQIRSGDLEHERVRNGVRDSIDYRDRVRQKDIRKREVSNGGYRAPSSRSVSESGSDVPRSSGFAVRMTDQEPGELPVDGSNEAVDSKARLNTEMEVKELENGNHMSPLHSKKRKFSPIIWDRDDREVKRTVKSRTVSVTATTTPPPPMVKSDVQMPKSNHILGANVQAQISDDIEVGINKESPSKADLQPHSSDFLAEKSYLPPENEPLADKLQTEATDDDGDNLLPTWTIISSRWANDADSPADEGEIFDYEYAQKLKRRSGSESAEVRDSKSISPELGEIRRDGYEGRERCSGSGELVRSSSRDNFRDSDDKNDNMEVDEVHSDDDSGVSHSDTESEDNCVSPESAQQPQRSVNMLRGCRSVNEFERLNEINEGTYGIVFRARDTKTGEIVALKKVKMKKEREGFPLTSLREINILLSLHHPSIVDVKEVVVGSSLDDIFMVMEYMEHDLKGLVETMKQPFSQSEVKCLMLQLIGGIKYLHDNWVLHRDLKTSNLLLNNSGELKICDFGLARQYGSPLKPYTNLVVTLWYRAPELLLGAKQYSTAIDMWSLGCIMAELLAKEALFKGERELDQLDKIFRVLGTPNETIWPGCTQLPGFKVNFVKHKYNLLRKKFPATSFTGSPVLSDAGFDLLSKLLTYDPEKRITAEAALNHEWFREVPLPKAKEFMPTFPSQHAQDRRLRKRMKSPDPLEEQRRKELRQGELGASGLFGL